MGVGNHSFIYQAELELPRELVVKPKECATCSCEGVPLSEERRGDNLRQLFEIKKQHAPYCEHLADGIPRPKNRESQCHRKVDNAERQWGKPP